MRNITAVKELRHRLDLDTSFGVASCLALDSDSGLIYTAGDGLVVACHRAQDGQELWSLPLPEAAQRAGCDLAPASALTLFAHAPELEALCLGFSTGELLLLLEAGGPTGGPLLEEVGAVEGGVMAGQWSPDGEALALLTGAGTLLLMSKDWELLAEREVAPQGELPALAPASVALSWRGDGRYLATCMPEGPGGTAGTAGAAAGDAAGARQQEQGLRIQIWEREGCDLHAVGEPAPALYPLLSWQPNGRHLYAARALAATAEAQAARREAQAAQQGAEQGGLDEAAHQKRIGAWKRELRRKEAEAAAAAAAAGEASNRVILFERNGLQHGGFDLPGGGRVLHLEWSRDSELLAIALADEEGGAGLPACQLQLWHRSNWHWYLKCERRYDACAGLALQWDEMAPRQLHVLTGEGDYQQLEFDWEPLVSRRGTAAVIDGRRLLLTPLRHVVIPPPMCAAAVRCSAAVSCAALCDFGESEVLAAVLSDGSLELAACCEEDLWEETLDEYLEQAEAAGAAGAAAAAEGAGAGAGPSVSSSSSSNSGAAAREPQLPATPLRVSFQRALGLAGARQAAWAGEGRLLVVAGSGELMELSIDAAAGTAAETATCAAPSPVLRCISHPRAGCIIQIEGGRVLQYLPGGQLKPCPESDLPSSCPRMAAAPAAVLEESAGPYAPLAFGLSPKGQLYWGPQLVASDVTSFVLRSEGAGGAFLLYTTRSHKLCTLPLAGLQHRLLGVGGAAAGLPAVPSLPQLSHPAQQAQQAQQAAQQSFSQAMKAAMRPSAGGPAKDARVRAIEQNSKLVAAPLGGETVILQMPRGNLEAVRPRALVLPAIAAAIDEGDYAHAWELAAVNRLDLNVLVDYRWPAFLDRVGEFIAQVPGDQDIADLLSSLSQESTVAEGGLYAGALPATAPMGATAAPATAGAAAAAAGPLAPPAAGSALVNGTGAGPAAAGASAPAAEAGGKVAAVCRAARAALQAVDPARYLRSILTSYAKCGELEGALAIVKQRKEAELQAAAFSSAPTAEDGLKHLLLFINEDVVYRAALGMYDLPLAYMVVAHSQKDPGEYMLELQRFATLPEGPLRCHAVDLHLRRFDSALRHIVAAGPAHAGEALALARERGLLRTLLELYEGQPELRAQALEAYAEELERKDLDEDAGLAYVAAGLPERAIDAYMAAGQWRMALALAGRLGRGPEEMKALAAELASELSGSHRPAEAAAVRLEYLQDVVGAVSLLAHGREWREALRVAYSYGRADLVESVLAPQAAAAAAEVLKDSIENLERVEKYSARLKDIRRRREELQTALAAAEEASGLPSRQRAVDDLDDAASEAPSAVSGLSVYTDRTHTGATTVSGATSLAPSTVGGRRPQWQKKKNKSMRIRQGSPEEEEQVANHLLSLAPSAALCNEVGQLTEVLIILGHEADARLLQQRLAALSTAQQAAVQDVLLNPPPALALKLSWPAEQALAAQQAKQAAAGSGPAPGALPAAVAGVLAVLPGAELQLKASQAEAALKGARWKWDILRSA